MNNPLLDIVFAGDFAPCRGFEPLVLAKNSNIFGDALPIIRRADIAFANLECPLTGHTQPINKSGPALRASPLCIEALLDFSVLGLANNHVLDYGKKGLEETMDVCNRAGLPTLGAGLNLQQAQGPFFLEAKGVTVAIIGLAEHEFSQSENGGAGSAPIDPIANYHQIKQARQQADIVIVTLHGGNEHFPYPRPGHRKLCQHYIDLGAEAVICHHPHVPGAYEYYQGKPIIYSLGNLIFDTTKPPKGWDLGYMARIQIDVDAKTFTNLELIPYEQSVELGGVRLIGGERKQTFLQRVETYRTKLENGEAWLAEWRDFVDKQAANYILRQYLPFLSRGKSLLGRKLPAMQKLFFSSRKGDLDKLNILRCQSHRELLTTALESRSKPRND